MLMRLYKLSEKGYGWEGSSTCTILSCSHFIMHTRLALQANVSALRTACTFDTLAPRWLRCRAWRGGVLSQDRLHFASRYVCQKAYAALRHQAPGVCVAVSSPYWFWAGQSQTARLSALCTPLGVACRTQEALLRLSVRCV